MYTRRLLKYLWFTDIIDPVFIDVSIALRSIVLMTVKANDAMSFYSREPGIRTTITPVREQFHSRSLGRLHLRVAFKNLLNLLNELTVTNN